MKVTSRGSRALLKQGEGGVKVPSKKYILKQKISILNSRKDIIF